jgi:hypothetical protein
MTSFEVRLPGYTTLANWGRSPKACILAAGCDLGGNLPVLESE